MISEFIAGMLGTMAFSILFGVPSRYYVYCGMIWKRRVDYLFRGGEGLGAGRSISACHYGGDLFFQAGSSVEALSGDDFSDCRVFPLVPGSGIYWTTYYLVTDQLPLALHTGYQAVKCAMAIVLGIVLIFELPQSLFARLLRQKNR